MKKRILSAASFVLALVTALFATTPALAATTYTPIGGSTAITKNLVVDSDTNVPDVTFGYRIQRGTPVTASSSRLEILVAPDGATATIGSAVFSNEDTNSTHNGLPNDPDGSTTEGKKYAQKSVAVTFPVGSFTKPGVYRYVINEVIPDGDKHGIIYDSAPYRYLDVFVVADSSNVLSVDSYVLRSTASDIDLSGSYVSYPDEKSAGYTNLLTQYDFSFDKTIAGNQGDKNNRFTFTLNVTNALPGTYPVTAVDVTGNQNISSITVDEHGSFTGSYELTNSSSFKILGISQGAVCSVSEQAQDYTATHVVDSGSSLSGNSSGDITMNADHTVAFTNKREGIIPTGVILTIAPFAIGVLVFGALAITFVSKSMRRSY